MSERCGLRFGLLGAPAVYDAEGEPHPVRSAKGRALLAALLLEPDRVVSLGALKDALWGDFPPASAQASLQNHVTRLRRLLDDPRRLQAVPPGYRLRVGDGELDVRVFERLVAQVRAAHAAGDWARTVARAADALALWRGTPLSGLPDSLDGHPLVPRLEEARLLTLQWRYDAELALGTGLASLAPELAALVAEHPLREAFHRQLMLVLHRTGRQAEALAVHRELRRRLIEELGVEPGAAVRDAHGEVLGAAPGGEPAAPGAGEPGRPGAGEPGNPGAGEPGNPPPREPGNPGAREPGNPPPREPGNPGAGTSAAAPSPPVLTEASRPACTGEAVRAKAARPAQLPPAPAHFTGRDGTVRSLRLALAGGSRVAVVSGMAGVGKSALAVHAAHALREEFPDGQLYVNLRGATPGMTPLTPCQALAALLRDLGAEPPHTPASHACCPNCGAAGGRTSRCEDAGRPEDSESPGGAGVGCASSDAVDESCVLAGAVGAGRESPDATSAGCASPGAAGAGCASSDVGGESRVLAGAVGVRCEASDAAGVGCASPGAASVGRESADAASALLRSLLAPTRTLMVLDDAATAAQVRPLLPAGAGCAVIVTSRSPLTALDGAARFPLAPLSDRDSAALLRAVSGRAGLDAGHPLIELAGRLPLALRIVAARLAARRALTPDALAELLTVSGGRLHHLEYDDLSVRRSLAVALDALRTSDREADRDAARALTRIGALDLPTYGVPLLARLLGTDELRAGAALDRLVDVALLEETSYGRYAPHDLVRDFARETATRGRTGEAVCAGLVEEAFRWYAESARRTLLAILPEGLDRSDRLRGVEPRLARTDHAGAEVSVSPSAEGGTLTGESTDPSVAGTSAADVPMSAEDAFAWGDTELANILALADRHSDPVGLLPVLVRCLFPYLQRRGRLTELAVLGALALDGARRQGDAAAEAQALTDLAGLHFMSGRSREALALNDEALTLWRALGIVSCVRRGLNNRGLLLEGLGRHTESAEALHQSLDLAHDLADPLSEAITLSHLGNLYEHTDARAAIAHHERSLAIGETIGHAVVRQSAHCNIGYAHLTLGEPAAALGHFEESLRLHGEYEDWHGASQARLGLVRALRGLSRSVDAARECAALLDRAEQRGDTHMTGLARHQRGLLLRAAGRDEEAYEQWRAALRALDGTDSKVSDELRALLAAA
ncbi:BTAD domain-containing putative transcriptional regulator [Streptomyces sp. NPDC050732]|uniref:BTAD domain-containing putative transcriptional regulator n=1 Tax=Streptomyces sp. NPDC050732 TaxID=3154632 RepID=UPI0034493AE8